MANLLTGVSMEYVGQSGSRLFYTPLFRSPSLQKFFTLLDGVQSRTSLPVAGPLQKITRVDPGCGHTETGTGVGITERSINVEKMVSFLQHCPRVFDNTVFERLRNSGVDINNIEGTEIEAMILRLVSEGLQNDLMRQLFFNHTAAVSNDYNAYDGVWSIIKAGVTATDIVRSDTLGAITLDPCDAKEIIRSLIRKSTPALRQVPKSQAMILVTGALFDNLLDCKMDNTGPGLFNLEKLEKGFGDVDEYEFQWFEGYKVYAMRSWDVWNDDLGETNPHRAILWVPSNHFIATDTAADFNQMKVWYSQDDDQNKTLARYMIGYNYAMPELITVAF